VCRWEHKSRYVFIDYTVILIEVISSQKYLVLSNGGNISCWTKKKREKTPHLTVLKKRKENGQGMKTKKKVVITVRGLQNGPVCVNKRVGSCEPVNGLNFRQSQTIPSPPTVDFKGTPSVLWAVRAEHTRIPSQVRSPRAGRCFSDIFQSCYYLSCFFWFCCENNVFRLSTDTQRATEPSPDTRRV